MPILVKDEHIKKGIEAYGGKQDPELERIFAHGNLDADIYAFNDGRYLVCYKLLKKAMLYSSKEELMSSIVLD